MYCPLFPIKYNYIGSPDGLLAIRKTINGTSQLYYILTDHLGSIDALCNTSGDVVERYSYDAWGNRRNPSNWSLADTRTTWITSRGFTGHEHLDKFGLINANARMYEPLTGKFLAPDPFVQAPEYSQSFNRYAYCWNNPLKYTDPSGEIVWAPIIIGAIVGAYIGGSTANETYNPADWNYKSGKTWGYMLGGLVVGGVSGGLAYSVATSGMAFANTASIVTGSFTNSVGMQIVTGGQTDVSVSFGFGSYNFDTGEFGYLGKKGNSAMQNIGYGLGALANIQDAFAGLNGGNIDVKSRKEIAGHSWIEGDDINISVGPAESVKEYLNDLPEGKINNLKWETQYFKTVKGHNFITRYDPSETFSTTLNNVNVGKLQRMTNFLNRGLSLSGKHSLNYGVWNGCVNQTSRALFRAGVFNVNAFSPITSPVLLNAELALRNYGMMFSYYMTLYR